jgi:hypothetical protein
MIEKLILYVIYEKPLYGYGMVFDPKGVFQYAVYPSDVKNIKENGLNRYIIIDPKEKTLHNNEINENSILLISSFFDQLFKKDSLVMDSKPFFDDIFSKMLLDYDFNSKKILDYGSGYDTYSKYFPKSEYVGYDLNKEIHLDDLQNETYDYVLCNFVLEHVSNIEKTIEQISIKLKSKGLFFIFIPSLSLFEFIKFYVIKLKMEIPIIHYRTFGYKSFPGCVSFQSIRKTMEKYNIKQQQISGIFRINNKKFQIKIKPVCYFGNQTIIVGEKYE